jgi:hypothetical protein
MRIGYRRYRGNATIKFAALRPIPASTRNESA